jgi:hypothetical protein
VSTVRFSEIVKIAGEPDVHLLLTDPAQDTRLKKAVSAHRVMTIHQTTVGTKRDYGTVGFVKGATGQFLIFPKSIGAYEGRTVVGIKYDLLKHIPDATVHQRPHRKPPSQVHRKKPDAIIIPFDHDASPDPPATNPIRTHLERAVLALEQGRQVAAHRILTTVLRKI